ncbi:MAG: hypothetical protein IPJ19_18630 [Planctomycetes bacterium]|nr:hypothetical protein [Planctomycetota bacterium]
MLYNTRLGITTALLIALGTSAQAQWPSNPAQNLAVCNTTGDQAVPKVAAGGDGSTWCAWFDNRGGSYAVYAQKLDPLGNEAFAHNGLLVSANPQSTSLVDWDIDTDGAGGCVIVFTDTRAGGDLDVYAYRIDGAGNFLWGANGVPLSNNADYEANPKVALLSDGNFAVTWSRLPNSGAGAVHVQKLDPAGTPQFAGDGLQIVGPGTEKPGFSDIAAADAGGWIVGYVRDIGTFASPRHLRAQKFDSAGNALWNGGSPLAIYDAASLSIAYQPVVKSDGGSGAVFAWHSAIGNTFDCWVQRVDAAGVEAYAHNGLQVSTEANMSKFDPSVAVLPGSGDLVVAFNKRNLAQSQWASCVQRISVAGARQFTANGVELLPLNGIPKQFERCLPLGNDAIVLSCEQTNYPAQGLRVLGFRVDASGANVWTGSPVVVSSVLSQKDKIPVCIDATNMARALWDDARNDSGDMYAQNLNADGSLGPPALSASAFCFGDGTQATACPCANNGAAGRGCQNSASTGGAQLLASGSTSPDTLVLSSDGELPSVLTIFLQGNAALATPAVFGDGVRCVGGSLKRLYTKNAVAGTATAPAPGDPSVSARSAALGDTIGSGTQRWYQAYYRDPNLSFCAAPPGSSWNVSSGLRIDW